MKTDFPEKQPDSQSWWVYLIRTNHGHLYCGITKNVELRLKAHSEGKGAKYLRGKTPLTLEWSRFIGSRSLASHYEIRIKRLSKYKKEKLITNPGLFEQYVPDLSDGTK
ncbi:GIY-YIG nuclease family protein [Vibrio salinus]|uniref:GIY-YIG nuclease family protein n=1 Tax=Vibrio salinus TaxID=2899784 RepID=UPI001E431C7D|nr:GIY-YIG nuclease family protein [Vibrio salinus]MCE0496032.1 GIY-YIG nuclease family protein [Vibrio salinus]